MFNQPPQDDKKNPIEEFSTSTIDKVSEARKKAEENKEKMREMREQYKAALNRVLSTPDGQFVMKQLIDYCGVFTFDNAPPDGRLAEDKGKRKVYLEAIRPFLDKTIKMEIET